MKNDEPKSPAAPGETVLARETRTGRYQVEIDAGGTRFFADEPVALGGLGSGPNPYELLGAALAACTTMTMRLYADRKGWPVDNIAVEVSHSRATLATRDRFDRRISVTGALDADQQARLLDIANRCPVHLTLERGADVRTMMQGATAAAMPAIDQGSHTDHMVESCQGTA